MVMVDGRLRRDDWVSAGFAALCERGAVGVAMEPVAARLGTTKGSGYWHFRSRNDLLAEVLEHFRLVNTARVIEQVERAGGGPRQRLHALLALVTSVDPGEPNEALALLARTPETAGVLDRIHADRLAYVRGLLIEAGVGPAEAARRALVAYAMVAGVHVLATSGHGLIWPDAAAHRRWCRCAIDLLVPGG